MLPFPSSVDHIWSELFTVTRSSLVALNGMAHSFIELHKSLHHDRDVIHEGAVQPRTTLIGHECYLFCTCFPLGIY